MFFESEQEIANGAIRKLDNIYEYIANEKLAPENAKGQVDRIKKVLGRKMKKKLSEMSLEELWKLFPIYLTEHQSYWKEWYTDEENFLKNRVPKIERISHIGSTAISSICAKPIIDILVEISKDYKLSDYKEVIVKSGYICMSETSDRISFNKGYTEKGFAEKVFHLHLRYIGDNDELYFRDYLIEHTNIALEYEKMKLKLWKKFKFNRDGYTNSKTDFIQKYTEKAKLEYGERY